MFKDKLSLVPSLPGSYQMLDKDGKIIYVGKAKNLKRRISSYFNRPHTGKTAKMVSLVNDFTYIVANSEAEAFLIEINLIKKYNPKYNILLKDDKSYPYIEYISKPYPRLKLSRYLNIRKKDNKILFGPYPNAYAARHIVNLINRLYPLKKCNGNPKEVCLYYHIGECLGYCSKVLDKNKVLLMEKEILSFLKGNNKILKDKLKEKMNTYASSLKFELANEMKKELEYITLLEQKQEVELHDLINRDVFAYILKDNYVAINIFFLRNGKLIGSKNDILNVTDDYKEILESYIVNFYLTHEIPKEVIIDVDLNIKLLEEVVNTKFIIPQKGLKKDLLRMSKMNAEIYYNNEIKLLEKEEKRTKGANDELAKLLKMDEIRRIDIFDNSNLFGDYAVSAMVVYVDGKPSKKDYRKYHLELQKNDDYHEMQEVIYRRYQRALVEKETIPDLIIVDGGEIQMNACNEVLKQLNLNIKVVGLKKDDKHATNSLINSNLDEIPLDVTSDLFHYLTRMQDEVHRFAINYHRQIRSKGTLESVLNKIDGIGKERRIKLLKKYGSITKIKEASLEELSLIIPRNVASKVLNYLKEDKHENN